MKRPIILLISKKVLYPAAFAAGLLLILCAGIYLSVLNKPANIFADPKSGIIVIDPGHGGVDGGTSKDEMLEKDINLSISQILKDFLKQNGYKVVMTREKDVSLDTLNNSSQSRHQRDLNARADIINQNNAQLFVSIHVNCNLKRPETDGSIVFYSDKFQESKTLAYNIQRTLNAMIVNGMKRTVHDPQQAGYFILNNSKVPGAIVETAFISNAAERRLLATDDFREQLATAIGRGIIQYLNEPGKVYSPVSKLLIDPLYSHSKAP